MHDAYMRVLRHMTKSRNDFRPKPKVSNLPSAETERSPKHYTMPFFGAEAEFRSVSIQLCSVLKLGTLNAYFAYLVQARSYRRPNSFLPQTNLFDIFLTSFATNSLPRMSQVGYKPKNSARSTQHLNNR